MPISRDIFNKLCSFLCINIGNDNFKGNLFHNYWAVWGETKQVYSSEKFENFEAKLFLQK
ncbi:hypothetical protein T10_3123 [Trichinella papuae]|uniref:Uncharacterized protein n=1 Tax=Trichinella papuae TaxID=268474 RepID=A0A0V1LWQ2_9BILA|nr:hypothetical protein T10_3123 [Trichinella papuae]